MEEKTKSSEVVFQGELLDVRKDKVTLPNGEIGTREWINHPGAVCIIPILPNKKIGLIRQYRYSVKKHMVEIPAGKLDRGEYPEKCAKRELEEEIGYKANKISSIIAIIGLFNLPVIKYSVDWWNTLHQPSSITLTSAPAIHHTMIIPLLIMLVGLASYSLIIFLMKFKINNKKNYK